jgi:probable rRNA maturation factor
VKSSKLRVEIINRSGRAVPQLFLKRWVRHVDELAGQRISPQKFRGKEMVIAFLDEKAARALNKSYRDKNYATDVLSFESDEPGVLGELVICPTVISRQAREHGLLVREELGYMVLHGFLHLLGYDHERSARDAKRMFALQDEIFEEALLKLRA